MATRLTKKQEGFVRDYVLLGNGTKAALNNYTTKDYNTAHVIASENLQKPTIIEAVKAAKKTIAELIPDELIVQAHTSLLKSTTLDHMVFPLGPKGEDDENYSGGRSQSDEDDEEEGGQEEVAERTTLADQEIISMLAEVNCQVRRIVHGESARHVYFWSPDNQARSKGVDMAHKLKGTYAPEKMLTPTTQQNITVNNIKVINIANEYEQKLKDSLQEESASS